ncbi:MAG TPA: DUF2264 domain-containing protein [Bryobacteraceae bacterium]|nr:DUF2264 domain-containing protein [Bryobacteraceae bacterium]
MTDRRRFLQSAAGLGMAAAAQASPGPPAETDRAYWTAMARKLASPVLGHLAAGTLKRAMPVECATGNPAERARYTHLEALGRLLCGLAPWLESGDAPDLSALARQAIHSATDPQSPDFLNFHEGGQPLVDCGFLAQAILRAPHELWETLDPDTRRNLAAALASSRAITPGFNNWLLFSATVEAALARMGEPWDALRIDYALRQHQQWYKGDGVYGDGPTFHWDYYNSFVIQPMLLDVLHQVHAHNRAWESMVADTLSRARRYAAIEERLIAPDGSYPAVGRSIAYRCGAFQVLAQMALLGELPSPLTPGGVRSALTAVMRRTLGAPGTFDAEGWLRVGLCGHQPHLGESYISTGSLYLCAAVLLPLGRQPSDPFWTAPAAPWTARRLWQGEDAAADHALG